MSKIVFTLLVALAIFSSSALGKVVLQCNRQHEEYQCGSACQTTCENYGEPCPIVNIRCNDGCYCVDGYARDTTDTCIPISECY